MHPQMLQDLAAVRRTEALARAERNRMVAAAREARRSRGGSPAEARFFLAGALKLGRAVRRLGPAAPAGATRSEEGCATC
jgi:hypothetical protein